MKKAIYHAENLARNSRFSHTPVMRARFNQSETKGKSVCRKNQPRRQLRFRACWQIFYAPGQQFKTGIIRTRNG
ncbi:MAG TPA: hypothetical protein VGB68_19085 [Pyrinomonadaceae bacterium]